MSEKAPKSGEFNDGKFWFHRKGSMVTLGLTSLGIEDVGAVQSLELPSIDDDFTKGDVVVTVDGSNGKIEVSAPASGVVKEINEAAVEEPDMVSDDPLEEGWLVKLEVEDTSELKEYSA
jgi:glycine cleavage system H protein